MGVNTGGSYEPIPHQVAGAAAGGSADFPIQLKIKDLNQPLTGTGAVVLAAMRRAAGLEGTTEEASSVTTDSNAPSTTVTQKPESISQQVLLAGDKWKKGDQKAKKLMQGAKQLTESEKKQLSADAEKRSAQIQQQRQQAFPHKDAVAASKEKHPVLDALKLAQTLDPIPGELTEAPQTATSSKRDLKVDIGEDTNQRTIATPTEEQTEPKWTDVPLDEPATPKNEPTGHQQAKEALLAPQKEHPEVEPKAHDQPAAQTSASPSTTKSETSRSSISEQASTTESDVSEAQPQLTYEASQEILKNAITHLKDNIDTHIATNSARNSEMKSLLKQAHNKPLAALGWFFVLAGAIALTWYGGSSHSLSGEILKWSGVTLGTVALGMSIFRGSEAFLANARYDALKGEPKTPDDSIDKFWKEIETRLGDKGIHLDKENEKKIKSFMKEYDIEQIENKVDALIWELKREEQDLLQRLPEDHDAWINSWRDSQPFFAQQRELISCAVVIMDYYEGI